MKRPCSRACAQQKEYSCDAANVQAELCTEDELGSFILSSNATAEATNPIISRAIHLRDPKPVNYPIKKTGYYCVGTYGYSVREYKAVVEFRNAYGELPAAQIAKLPFYGGLAIVYAVVGAYVDACASLFDRSLLTTARFWAFLYVQNRHDICEYHCIKLQRLTYLFCLQYLYRTISPP